MLHPGERETKSGSNAPGALIVCTVKPGINPCRAAPGIFRTRVYVRVNGSRNIPDFRIPTFLGRISSANLGVDSELSWGHKQGT